MTIKSKEIISERNQVDLIYDNSKEKFVWSKENLNALTEDEIFNFIGRIDDQAFLYTCTLLWTLRDRYTSDLLFGQCIERAKNNPDRPLRVGGQPRINKMLHLGKFCEKYEIYNMSEIGILKSVMIDLASPKHKEIADRVLKKIRGKNLSCKEADKIINDEMSIPTEKQEEGKHLLLEDVKAVKEKDLYPKLQEYLKDGMHLYSRRIEEGSSPNSDGNGANEWLHPDIVAIEDPKGNSVVRIFSYEVKRELNTTNARKSFFQALANSGWAYQGYLVAPIIDEKVREELKYLSDLYGIGVIQLDVEIPSQSKQYPHCEAKKNLKDNWAAIDRIRTNKDFNKFMNTVEKCRAATCVVDESYWNDF